MPEILICTCLNKFSLYFPVYMRGGSELRRYCMSLLFNAYRVTQLLSCDHDFPITVRGQKKIFNHQIGQYFASTLYVIKLGNQVKMILLQGILSRVEYPDQVMVISIRVQQKIFLPSTMITMKCKAKYANSELHTMDNRNRKLKRNLCSIDLLLCRNLTGMSVCVKPLHNHHDRKTNIYSTRRPYD